MKEEFKKQIPNLLTIARIILIPLIIVSFYIPWKMTNLVVAFLFALASITDYYDGKLARKFKIQSNFGRCFDPIADKLLVVVALVMLVNLHNDNLFILIPSIVIICREILVSGLREFLATIQVSVPVTYLAKVKTTVQMCAITGLLLASKNSSYTYEQIMDLLEAEPFIKMYFDGFVQNISTILLNIAAVLTAITGYAYLKVGFKNM